jgi:hypothetical protein
MQTQEIITEWKEGKSYYNRSMNINVAGDRYAYRPWLNGRDIVKFSYMYKMGIDHIHTALPSLVPSPIFCSSPSSS